MYYLLFGIVFSLSYVCNYEDLFGSIGSSYYLYKEDNLDQVKWLEKYEYCRAKGDTSVYFDAGQGKCEYSRGICYWGGDSCLETNRENDPKSDCEYLYLNNVLTSGLDNGRSPQQQISGEEQQSSEEQEQQSSEEQSLPPQIDNSQLNDILVSTTETNCFSTYSIGGLDVWSNSIVLNDTLSIFNFFNTTMNTNEIFYVQNSSNVISKNSNILYGSFRILAKVPQTNWSFTEIYYTNNFSQKISFNLDNMVSLSTGGNNSLMLKNNYKNIFSEYRFDWYQQRVDFYINSKYLDSIKNNIPVIPGSLAINHGLLRNLSGTFGNISSVVIQKIEVYFNTTESTTCDKIIIIGNQQNSFTFEKYGPLTIVSSILFLFILAYGYTHFSKKLPITEKDQVQDDIPPVPDVASLNIFKRAYTEDLEKKN